MLIEAKDLVNGVSVAQQEAVSVVEYFHVELETHDVIFAEGTLSETFVDMDNRGMFQNAHEYAATCPARTTSEPEYYAPRLDHGYEVESVRRYLERRAGLTTIGGTKGELRGYVDCICSNSISGWAQNTDYPEAPVCLDVYVGGCLVGQALANLYREDLMRAGVGSGHHAFTLEVPAKLSRSDTVQVRRSIDGTLLNRSQKNTHFI